VSDNTAEGRVAIPVWRALALTLLVLVAGSVLAEDASAFVLQLRIGHATTLADIVLTLVWLTFAGLVIGRGRRRLSQERDARAAEERRAWNLFVNLFAALGYAYLLLVALSLLRVDLRGILVGGAVTGIVLGIAAQSALGNLFGGMLVLLLHPYGVGQRIMVRSSLFGGTEYSGVVREVTLFHTVLDTGAGRLVIPNSITVAAVVRVEGNGDWETATVPVPYRVSLDQLRSVLRDAGLPDAVHVEGLGGDAYTVRLRVPAIGGEAAMVAVMQRLSAPSA
jgi:small conductance mechanosensitive channel